MTQAQLFGKIQKTIISKALDSITSDDLANLYEVMKPILKDLRLRQLKPNEVTITLLKIFPSFYEYYRLITLRPPSFFETLKAMGTPLSEYEEYIALNALKSDLKKQWRSLYGKTRKK